MRIENGEKVLYSANAGDARAVHVPASTGQPKRLTYDHKASDLQEQKRCQELGAFFYNFRLDGTLAVTRSMGDFGYKAMTCEPYV